MRNANIHFFAGAFQGRELDLSRESDNVQEVPKKILSNEELGNLSKLSMKTKC